MSVINISNLYKSFGDKEVLKGIDFKVDEGEILGVLGPSGAGKTTLIEIMIGHLESDKGTSKIFNVSSTQLKDDSYSKIGTVLDEAGLFERLTCRQNLEIFRKIYSIDKDEVDAVLHKVGLYESSNVAVDKLSKGMKQRLVLARAIMHKPSLLFLDEPTSGLDPSTSQLIHKLLLELKQKGTTILLVTHNMQEATDLCDKVAFLFDGKIIEYDTPTRICDKHNELNQISIVTNHDKEFKIPNNKESYSEILNALKDNEIKSIHSSEPNLGEVFISLTGKELI